MATKKKTRRKTVTANAKRRAKPTAKALAITDPVLREDVTPPKNRDGFMQMAFAWSPLGLLLAAQAAFWEGLVGARGPRV